jgi:uracil-DNA glycosylase family 4
MAPFVGGSGRIRNALLNHAGMSQLELYTTNVVKCRPPGNRLPTDHEVACCAKFLLEEIEEIQPNVIIAAGDLALKTTTGKSKIGLWRGVPTEGPRLRVASSDSDEREAFKVFPTWHPAFIMRSQWNWPFAVHDLARAKAQSTFPEIRRIPFTIERRADFLSTKDALLRDIRTRGAVTFDFETSGLSPERDHIKMCGFVGRPDQAYVYDWTIGVQRFFEELFADPEIEIVGQNVLTFDIPFALGKGHSVRWERVFDTMVAFHLTNSSYGSQPVKEQNAGNYQGARGTEKDLSFIASNHTDIEYWKSKEAYKGDLYGVCGVDVIATDRSAFNADGLKAEIRAYEMEGLYERVRAVHPVMHSMTRRGVKINEERAAAWHLSLTQEADRIEGILKEGVGDPFFNFQSAPQMMDLLYNKMGLPVQYLTDKKKGRRPTANAEAIEFLAETYPDVAFLRGLVDMRHLRKMDSTYVLPGLAEGRLHPRFGISRAANGRFNGYSPNAQNVPEMMRDIWEADSPEHVLLSADSSQIEWRLAMVLSGDPVGLELLTSGRDNHKAVASEAMSVPYDEVDDDLRHAAKFIVYGLGYGRGAPSIAAGHGLDVRFVQEFIGRFFKRFQTFYRWREALVTVVQKNCYLMNPYYRRRFWYTREITEIYNFPASSTAADMMIDELIELEASLPKGATLRLTVHDEVVVNTPKDIVRETADCVRETMQRKRPHIVDASARPEVVRRFYPDGWFCPADVHAGTNWAMCKSKDKGVKAEREALEKHLGLID